MSAPLSRPSSTASTITVPSGAAGTIVSAAGVTTAASDTVTITAVNNTADEPNRTVTVTGVDTGDEPWQVRLDTSSGPARRTIKVPEGIDPGFVYAPGARSQAGEAARHAIEASIAQTPSIAAIADDDLDRLPEIIAQPKVVLLEDRKDRRAS